MKRVFAVFGIALVLAGCSAQATVVSTSPPSGTPGPTETTSSPASTEPTATSAAIKTYNVGDTIQVTGSLTSGDVQIRVVQVQEATHYGAYSKPSAGNVYLAVDYEYVALQDGATYNPFDWQVFVDGTAVQNYTMVLDGPSPELSSGTLPKGRKASGWVVYEVPKTGEVLLSYGATFGGETPSFEVVARAK